MPSVAKTTYDVFISHTPADAALAASLAESFRSSGLEPFTDREIAAAENLSDAVWEALAECKALVAILSRSELSASMSVEIGAAQAWNKPIYVVVADPATIRLPNFLTQVRVVSAGAVEDVVREVQRSSHDWTDDDRQILVDAYLRAGVPVDRFASEHVRLRRLTDQFNKHSKKNISGERLLSELLRLRKSGKLPVLRKTAG